MAFQTYDPKTNTQTTYNGADASSGIAKVEIIQNGAMAPASVPAATLPPTPITPAAPAATPSLTTPKQNLTLANGQVISGTDPNYDQYAAQMASAAVPADQVKNAAGVTMAEANDPNRPPTPEMIKAQAVIKSVQSGLPMDEATAKEYALGRGEANWQKYLNGTNGNLNPNYIGVASFAALQKKYTPYQIEKATLRTKDGIYWNPAVNIADTQMADPSTGINKFAKNIMGAVDKGTSKTDVLAPKGEGTDEDKKTEDKTSNSSSSMVDKLGIDQGKTALEVYNEVMNTPGLDMSKEAVTTAKARVDALDQQIEELTDDIRKEVEGEAPESYINALAAVRGNSIMRLRRSAERDYNTALASFNAEKEVATNQMGMIIQDNNNRYNRAFQALQFAETQSQNAKGDETMKLNAMLALPQGTSYTFKDGSTVTGIKETDNVATGTFTDANRNIYYYAIDKKTGKEVFPKTLLGKAPAPSSGGSASTTPFADKLKETIAQTELGVREAIASGNYQPIPSADGKSIVYANTKAWEAATKNTFENEPGQTSGFLRSAKGYAEFWQKGGAGYVLDVNTGK